MFLFFVFDFHFRAHLNGVFSVDDAAVVVYVRDEAWLHYMFATNLN